MGCHKKHPAVDLLRWYKVRQDEMDFFVWSKHNSIRTLGVSGWNKTILSFNIASLLPFKDIQFFFIFCCGKCFCNRKQTLRNLYTRKQQKTEKVIQLEHACVPERLWEPEPAAWWMKRMCLFWVTCFTQIWLSRAHQCYVHFILLKLVLTILLCSCFEVKFIWT